MFERNYRDLAFVPRWGILPTNRTQSVAEHSFYVALYTSHICDFIRYNIHPNPLCGNEALCMLKYAIEHDRDEAYLSDIPGPVKRSIRDEEKATSYGVKMEKLAYGGVWSVSPLTKAVVKVADLMDEVAFLKMEFKMGNSLVESTHHFVRKRLRAAVGNLAQMLLVENHTNFAEELLSEFYCGISSHKTLPRNDDDLAS